MLSVFSVTIADSRLRLKFKIGISHHGRVHSTIPGRRKEGGEKSCPNLNRFSVCGRVSASPRDFASKRLVPAGCAKAVCRIFFVKSCIVLWNSKQKVMDNMDLSTVNGCWCDTGLPGPEYALGSSETKQKTRRGTMSIPVSRWRSQTNTQPLIWGDGCQRSASEKISFRAVEWRVCGGDNDLISRIPWVKTNKAA